EADVPGGDATARRRRRELDGERRDGLPPVPRLRARGLEALPRRPARRPLRPRASRDADVADDPEPLRGLEPRAVRAGSAERRPPVAARFPRGAPARAGMAHLRA